MTFAGVSYLAVVVAAVAAWVFGAVWYMTLAKPWIAAQGWRSKDDMPKKSGMAAAAPFIVSFIAELIMAWVLDQVNVWNGIVSAAFVWLGFVATTVVVNYAYPGRPVALMLIDSGHWLGVLIIMGAVIGAFGGVIPSAASSTLLQ
jgi:hypothetical protein